MKKFAAFFIILLCCLLLMGAARPAAPVSPSRDFYVNDYAGIISSEHRNLMLSMARELDEKTNAQIVTLTVESLGDMDAASYAYAVFEGWGIGGEQENNGVLILVSTGGAPGNRDLRIEVGYGLEGALTDIGTKHIQEDVMIPYLKNGDLSGGIYEGFKQVAAKVYEEYGMALPENVAAAPVPLPAEDSGFDFGTLLFILLFLVILSRVFRRNMRYRRGYGGFIHLPFHIHSHRRHDDDDDFPGGFGGFGGFGGGSSGGGFGGGGFGGGGFSGGGGHSGGGGSSSKW